MSLYNKHRIRKSNKVFKYFAKSNCNSALTFKSRRYKNDYKNLDNFNNIYINDNATFEKQCKTQSSISTSSTSMIDLEAK